MFIFPLDPKELFEDRRTQFQNMGIPRHITARVENLVTDCWKDGPGGWTYEWCREAERAKAEGEWMLAANLYGAARFPVVPTASRKVAMQAQADCMVRASETFPVRFERVMVKHDLASGGAFPVHVYSPKGSVPGATVVMTGGVDTGKMEMHRVALALTRLGKFKVVAMDMPGNGETDIPLSPDAEHVYHEVFRQCAPRGKKAIVGLSFGGHWAAKLALRGEVDAAINIGGPGIGVKEFDEAYAAQLPCGMTGIVANAMRLEPISDDSVAGELLRSFSLKRQGLLDVADCAPMLAINGDCDPYVVVEDVEVFRRYPSAEVWLLRGLTHCGKERFMHFIPAMIAWLRNELYPDSFGSRMILSATKCLLPKRA